MFNENSGLVRIWIRNIQNENSEYTREQVPALSNLREIVFAILDKEVA